MTRSYVVPLEKDIHKHTEAIYKGNGHITDIRLVSLNLKDFSW